MGSYNRLYPRIKTIMGLLGFLKLNHLSIIQNLFLFVSWILPLAGVDKALVPFADIKLGTTNAWASFFFFISWYLHWQFCFNDYDCKKVGGQGRFNQVMTVFQAIIVFNFWVSFRSASYSSSGLTIGVFQTASLLMYVINDLVGLFFDFKVLRPIRTKK